MARSPRGNPRSSRAPRSGGGTGRGTSSDSPAETPRGTGISRARGRARGRRRGVPRQLNFNDSSSSSSSDSPRGRGRGSASQLAGSSRGSPVAGPSRGSQSFGLPRVATRPPPPAEESVARGFSPIRRNLFGTTGLGSAPAPLDRTSPHSWREPSERDRRSRTASESSGFSSPEAPIPDIERRRFRRPLNIDGPSSGSVSSPFRGTGRGLFGSGTSSSSPGSPPQRYIPFSHTPPILPPGHPGYESVEYPLRSSRFAYLCGPPTTMGGLMRGSAAYSGSDTSPDEYQYADPDEYYRDRSRVFISPRENASSWMSLRQPNITGIPLQPGEISFIRDYNIYGRPLTPEPHGILQTIDEAAPGFLGSPGVGYQGTPPRYSSPSPPPPYSSPTMEYPPPPYRPRSPSQVDEGLTPVRRPRGIFSRRRSALAGAARATSFPGIPRGAVVGPSMGAAAGPFRSTPSPSRGRSLDLPIVPRPPAAESRIRGLSGSRTLFDSPGLEDTPGSIQRQSHGHSSEQGESPADVDVAVAEAINDMITSVDQYLEAEADEGAVARARARSDAEAGQSPTRRVRFAE